MIYRPPRRGDDAYREQAKQRVHIKFRPTRVNCVLIGITGENGTRWGALAGDTHAFVLKPFVVIECGLADEVKLTQISVYSVDSITA